MKNKINNLKKIGIGEDDIYPFYFDEFGKKYLLTNDFGNYVFLSSEEFKNFLEEKLNKKSKIYLDLWKKGFIKHDLSQYEDLKEQCRRCKASLFSGPGLHIVVVTKRCNQSCIYCQASAKGMSDKSLDMDTNTAKKAVDMILQTPNNFITIEFQGGEPLANWDTVKFIIQYAKKEAKRKRKVAKFSLVTNLSLMDENKLKFLTDELVGICTSLDGPREVHNYNRPYADGDSYKETVKWIKKYEERRKFLKKEGKELTRIGALVTISRKSLAYPKEIIDEYLKLNLTGIHLRSLSYLGYSGGPLKEKIGYSPEEFITFWKKAVDYIIKINLEGNNFHERGVQIMAKKILKKEDPGYTELNSPCGAGRSQLLYDYDGSIYTCDEGRMIEDDTFKIGNLGKDDYEKIIQSDTLQAVLAASILENQPCVDCVYKPYCGICPVQNYGMYGTLFPPIKNTDRCKINKAQFEYIFSKIRKDKYRKIFESWISTQKREK